jgi:hypothetical protein
MAYNLKDVFYLAANHEYTNSDYDSANEDGIFAIDVSAYVDPIAKGSRRGQGLAIYKVWAQVTSDSGTAVPPTEASGNGFALSVKPFTTTGDGLNGKIAQVDMTSSSDVCIWSGQMFGTASYAGSEPDIKETLAPSPEVPFVCVRDTIYGLFINNAAVTADLNIHYRMECAMITLDTATLNQLLRTQTV